MDAWLTTRVEQLAAASGTPQSRLEPTQYDIDAILELARAAGHGGGDPTNPDAPVLCYLLGFAAGNSGMDLHALIAAVQ